MSAHNISQLHKKILKTINATQRRLASQEHLPFHINKILVLGYSGNGKSSLIHALADNIITIDVAGELQLKARDPNLLTDILIGQGLGQHGTSIPGAYYDPSHQLIFWDCAGWGDPAPNGQDIINAASIRTLIRTPGSHIRILLVIDEGVIYQAQPIALQELLNEITATFPDTNQLCECLSIVITKHLPTRKPQNRLDLLSQAGQLQRLSESASKLLNFIVGNFDARVFLLPAPAMEGPYEFDKTSLIGMIKDNTTPSTDLQIVPYLNNESQLLALEWAEQLNRDTTEFLKTTGIEQILTHCHQQIQDHQGSISKLRVDLNLISSALRSLASVTDLQSFLVILKGYMTDIHPIDQAIDHMTFLQGVQHNQTDRRIGWNLPAWSTALIPISEQIGNLAKPPIIHIESGILSIKGPLVATSDVQTELTTHPPNATHIKMHASNSIVFDADIQAPSVNVICIAPHWVIASSVVRVLLNGTPGRNGLHGTIDHRGEPGQNGGYAGHFYGRAISAHPKNLENLIIETNGGSGGSGGNGGNGSNGADGRHGRFEVITSRAPYHRPCTGSGGGANNGVRDWLGWDIAQHEITLDGTRLYYQDQGMDGEAGRNGRCGGYGGLGGSMGSVIIETPQHRRVVHGNDGSRGNSGTSGTAGRGGTHGQHCNGVLLTGVSVRYETWHSTGLFGWGREIRHHHHQARDWWEVQRAHQGPRGEAPGGHVEVGTVEAPPPVPAPPIVSETDQYQQFMAFYQIETMDETINRFVTAI